MPKRMNNILDMLNTIEKFDTVNKSDYQDLPGVTANYAIVRTAIGAINAQAIEKISGEKSRAVEQKSVLRLAVERKMKDFARTARGINMNDAGFQQLFRLPESDNDQLLIATARQFAAKATEHKAAFLALGIPTSLIKDLEKDADALEKANADKTTAQTKTVGATAEIDKQIDSAMKAAMLIDIAMKNVYRNDPAKLAAWTSARHIRRTSSPAPKPPPADS